MTAAQLARRLGLRQQSIAGFEKREPAGEITLKQLRKIANALECDVFCAIVPRKSLRERVERRAADLARQEIETVAHSMALEAQETDPRLKADRIEQRKRAILDQRWSRLWD
jgi:predicted DNA-binding mobile mystery protein A